MIRGVDDKTELMLFRQFMVGLVAFRLITCYDGKGLEQTIAGLINSYYSALPVSSIYEPVDPSTVKLWFLPPDYEPETFAAVSTVRSLIGMVRAWRSRGAAPTKGFIYVVLNPTTPLLERYKTTLMMLSWARHSLEAWQATRGVVTISVDGIGDPVFSAVCKVLRCTFETVQVRSLVMTAPGTKLLIRRPERFRIKEAYPHKSREDVKSIVGIFNDAFSVYDTFWPWSEESAVKYYDSLFSRREAIVYVAHDKNEEPAGFVEAYLHPTLEGGIAGEISLLAVKREYQGIGLGSYLLSMAIEWLRSRGARAIYLVATPMASNLYIKLGFNVFYQFYKIRIPLSNLPDPSLDGVMPWSVDECPLSVKRIDPRQ